MSASGYSSGFGDSGDDSGYVIEISSGSSSEGGAYGGGDGVVLGRRKVAIVESRCLEPSDIMEAQANAIEKVRLANHGRG